MRAIKKSVSVLLALAMLCSLFMTTAFATDDDSSTATTIKSLSEITEMDGDYVLGADVTIDASTWSPIGTSTAPFTGTFDGNGKTITWSGSVALDDDEDYFGIFGNSSGTISNLNVKGSLTVTGNDLDYISPVVGYNSGTITEVAVSASLTASDCYNVGGVAGFNDEGTISYCENTGAIDGYSQVGGIVGENAGTISSCANTGAIQGWRNRTSGIGGIAGRNGDNDTATETGIIINCYNQGSVTSGDPEDGDTQGRWIGGIAGFQNSLSSCTNCYNTGVLSGYSYMDHTAGNNEGTVTNCYGLDDDYDDNYRLKDGTVRYTDDQMKGTSPVEGSDTEDTDDDVYFLTKLSGSTSNIWDQVEGYYPYLIGVDAAGTDTYTIEITSLPSTTNYNVGDELDLSGLAISAVYSDKTVSITTYTTSPAAGEELSVDDTTVVVSVTYEGVQFTLSFNITVSSTAGEIYLDVVNGNDANGGTTADTAVKTYATAVELAGEGGTVNVMNTVDLSPTSGDTASYYDNVTFKPYSSLEGAMFAVTSGTVTVAGSSMVIDGGEDWTLFSVTNGILRLRGGVTLQNCDTAVSVAGGEVQVNKTSISATSYSVDVSSGTFTLNDFGNTSISGAIKLAGGTSISVGAAIPCTLTVECASFENGITIAEGSSYTLTNADAASIVCTDSDYRAALSTSANGLVLAPAPVYLDGTADTNGNGTSAAPFNSLDDALTAANAAKKIIVVSGTVDLEAGSSYYDSVTFQRASGLTDAMFSVTSGTVTLAGSSMVLDGEGGGTLVSVTGGTLRLRGGVTLEDCAVAVEVDGGEVQVNKTSISTIEATSTVTPYSIKVADSNSTFTLNDFGGTSIDGTIYLGSGAYITAAAAITFDLYVESVNTAVGTVIVQGTSSHSLDESEMELIYVYGGSYSLKLIENESGNQFVIAE